MQRRSKKFAPKRLADVLLRTQDGKVLRRYGVSSLDASKVASVVRSIDVSPRTLARMGVGSEVRIDLSEVESARRAELRKAEYALDSSERENGYKGQRLAEYELAARIDQRRRELGMVPLAA